MNTEIDRHDWLRQRKLGIGSSDAPIIWGASKFCTPLELFDDKLSEEIEEETSFITERGNMYEPIARKLFSAEYNFRIKELEAPPETFQPRKYVSKDLEILFGNLDGISNNEEDLIEIKYQGILPHKAVDDESLPIRGGRVPEGYWIQVQHQLLIVGKRCFFVSYNPKDLEKPLRYVEVLRDEEFMMQHIQKCQEFWTCVQTKTPPPESEKDFKVLRKRGSKGLATRWLYLNEKSKEIEEEMAEIREKMLAMADHPKMTCHGVQLVKQKGRAGSIDYGKIPEVKKLEKDYLETFRKAPGKESWRVTPIGEKEEKEG